MGTFSVQQSGQLNIITCPEVIDTTAVMQLSKLSAQWLKLELPLHVLDFKAVKSMGSTTYRPFIALKQALNSRDKKLCSINMSASIYSQIQNDGLDSVFAPAMDINDAMKKAGIKTPDQKAAVPAGYNVEFINPFITAIKIAISVQANTPLTGVKPFVKDKPYNVDIGIASIISLSSEQFNGTIALCFPTAVFLEIYGNMFDEHPTEITRETEDAASELLNIIFGLAKAKLNNEKGYTIQKAIPTVLTGEKLKIGNTNVGMTVVLPFETKAGQFFVEVMFDKVGIS